MLRWTLVVLALANLLYFGWTQGLLGDPPRDQREPERLQAQVQPQLLRLMNSPEPVSAPSAPTPPPATAANRLPDSPATSHASVVTPDATPAQPAPPPATRCWQAGAYNPAQAQALRSALQASGLPAAAWSLDEVRLGGRWIVYMGRYNAEQMARKKTELREIKVDFREVNIAAGPGLALGTFSTEETAQQGLQDLARKGVRTARVEPERGETMSYVLRLPAVTDAQRSAVAGLGTALAGKSLNPCEQQP